MGNCQAAEAATVVIQHPGNNKVERIYWSISAHQVMSSNPGHYVALLITSPPTTARTENGLPVKHLKLLRPDDTLIMGQVYRLVSFEDVLKEFAAKKSVKLGKLIRECGGGLALDTNKTISSQIHQNSKPILVNAKKNQNMHEVHRVAGSGGSSGMGMGGRVMAGGRHHGGGGGGQWKPALQSIAEIGT